MNILFRLTIGLISAFFTFHICSAQEVHILRGTIFKSGTTVRLEGVRIYNKRTLSATKSNVLGSFELPVSKHDTIRISASGYGDQDRTVTDFTDITVFLEPPTILPEVAVKGMSSQNELKEIEEAYKGKGIYYKGRPPLSLLSPFGGNPLTFFYELLSKDGRMARRFHRFAESENDYLEVSRRFNDYSIKKVIPIKDEDIQKFKDTYRPAGEQISKWSDFDLLLYIKKSYADFQKIK